MAARDAMNNMILFIMDRCLKYEKKRLYEGVPCEERQTRRAKTRAKTVVARNAGENSVSLRLRVQARRRPALIGWLPVWRCVGRLPLRGACLLFTPVVIGVDTFAEFRAGCEK